MIKRKETHKLNVAKMFRKDIDNFRPVEHLRLFQNHSDQELLVKLPLSPVYIDD